MDDVILRDALKRKVLRRHVVDPRALVVDEVGLRHGAARVDLLVLATCLHGFELKSDRDTLNRLPSQVEVYGTVLDRATLVVGRRHFAEALEMIPEWWGVLLADVGKRGAIHFAMFRRPRPNPGQDLLALAKLLWRSEALSLLENLHVAEGFRSKPRSAIYRRLVEVMDALTLRVNVQTCLRQREGWRPARSRKSCDG